MRQMSLKQTPVNNDKKPIAKLWTLLPFLRPYRMYLWGAFIALLITSSSVLALGKGVADLVDYGFGDSNHDVLDHALTALLVIVTLLSFGTYARYYMITMCGESLVADLRRRIYDHMLTLSQSTFSKYSSGDILSKLNTDTTLIQVVIGSSLSVALRNLILLIGGITLLIISSPKLTGIVLLVVPLVVFPIIFLGKKLRLLSRHAQDSVAVLASHAEESIHGIKALQAYGRENIESKQFNTEVDHSLLTAKQRIRIRALLTAIVILLVFGSISVVLWIGGHDVLSHKMTAGQLSSFIFYAIVVAGATGAISEVIGDLQRAAGAADRIFEFLNIPPEIHTPTSPKSLPKSAKGKLIFEHVSFTYPSRDTMAIDDLTCTIEPGTHIAFVGPSGAGKSTIFNLLLRFFDYHQGCITLDGIELKKLSLEELRQQFAYVSQDPVITSGTIYDNIVWGNPNATMQQVEAAAKAAALDFINELPQGLHSHIGERGMELSGGQKQRIAIARAFLKDAQILLLDEATSSLDNENERLIQDALSRLMKGRTTLAIAHRLSTIQHAHSIIALDKGRIVETGTHKELLKKKGLYAKLNNNQEHATTP